ncbi:MAG TPA: hypothetical protein VGU46_09755 [Acidobacteriaceae bacterium]|nr:hypothetical protein [Acidobacteriaceae bacterium]
MKMRVIFVANVAAMAFCVCSIVGAQQSEHMGESTGKRGASVDTPGSSPAVNDYVACVFTPDQLAAFRLKPPMKILDADRAAATIKAATAAVGASVKNRTLGSAVATTLKTNLQLLNLVGMDAKEAQASIGTTLSESLVNASATEKQATASAVKEATNEALEMSFSPPADVACSISPLTYHETNQIFGAAISKNYVAYQVVARNLNADKEFQLHNVELAVDTDPCGTKEQFDAGRDRLLVRAMAIRNQSTDPRNFTIRIMEGVASVAGAAVGFGSGDYANGLAVFSALIPAGKAIFPDYTVDQLNRISDLTFSSSGQSRTVVPKNGVAMFVTFMPTKPLEQSWWIEQATQVPGGGPGTQACTNAKNIHPKNHKPWSDGNPKPVAYKDWGPDALLEFRRHSFVIVAGVHTTEDDALVPVIDTLDCQNGAKVLDLGSNMAKSAAPASLPCKLKGKNLEQVVSLELQNAKEAADSVGAIGPVTVTPGDSTTATAVFNGDDLRALNGTTYNVLWTNSQKLSKATEQVVKVQPYPILSSIEKDQLQLPVMTAGTLTVKGIHLKMADPEKVLKPVSEVDLTSPDGKTVIALKVDPNNSSNTDTQLSLPYTATTFTGKPAVAYKVTVLVDGKTIPGASDASLTLVAP